MRRIAYAALALVLGLAASAAAWASGDFEGGDRVFGSGSVRTQDRDVLPFHAVELEGSGNLTVRQGAPGPVRVETDDNILPLVKTEVVAGVLHLGLVPGARVTRVTRLEFTVAAPSLDALVLSGSGNIRSEGRLRGQSLTLEIRGSGNISCEARADRLEARIGGSGGIDARGSAEHLQVSIDGSGSVKAQGLASSSAEVRISGSGDADVFVTDTLDVTISGSGSVRHGGGARTSVHASGSGSVSAY